MKEKIKYVKQVVPSEGVGTKEGGTTRSLTAAEGRWCIPYLFYIPFTCFYYCSPNRYVLFIDDELIADDDDKQQLLNYMIQVCRPKDWQISLLEDRLAKRQLTSSQYHSQKRLDNVLKGELNV